MAVSLQKGGNVSLSKVSPGLKNIAIGLGWDVRTGGGPAFDLDASAFMLEANGKLPHRNHLVYYGNLRSMDGSVVHQGDNLTGEGEGDDEVINVYLDKVPLTIQKILVTVTIYQADKRKQNFGQVKNTFIRIVNLDKSTSPPPAPPASGGGLFGKIGQLFGSSPTAKSSMGEEVARYDLAETFSQETAMIFGELYRYQGEWKFRAVGQGFSGGLDEMLAMYK